MKKLLIFLFVLCSFNLYANLKNTDIKELFERNTNLSHHEINQIMTYLNKNKSLFETALYSDGFNVNCLYGKRTWDLEVFKGNEATKFPFPPGEKVFRVDIRNLGLTCDLSFQWVFIFMTKEMNMENIPGAIFTGWGAGLQFGGGLKVAKLTSKNRKGTIVYVSPRWGVGVGIFHQKMTFSKIEEEE